MKDEGRRAVRPAIFHPSTFIALEVKSVHPERYVGFTHSDGGVTFLIIPVSGSISSDRPMRVARHPITIISVMGPAYPAKSLPGCFPSLIAVIHSW